MTKLTEDKRNALVARSKRGQREKDGKTRFEKRLKSRVASNVSQFNKIDMNSLFKSGILTVNIDVKGETDNYVVTISFSGFLDKLREKLERANTTDIDVKTVIRALLDSFNSEDIYMRCNCDDFFYRFGYWNTRNKIITGEVQLIPSDITNPKDELGAGCKHLMLVLSNTSWLIKVASVIRNYIQYMERYKKNLYIKIIYPAIYGKKYEEPVQTSMFDDEDSLESDKETINASNRLAREKSRFKKDNPFRIRKQDIAKNQIGIEETEEVESEENDE